MAAYWLHDLYGQRAAFRTPKKPGRQRAAFRTHKKPGRQACRRSLIDLLVSTVSPMLWTPQGSLALPPKKVDWVLYLGSKGKC